MVLWYFLLFHTRIDKFPITLRYVPSLITLYFHLYWAHFWGLMISLGAPGKQQTFLKLRLRILPMSSSRSSNMVPIPWVLVRPPMPLAYLPPPVSIGLYYVQSPKQVLIQLVNPESQSVTSVDVSKVVGTSWLFVPVNAMEQLRQFRYWYFPWKARYQVNLEGFHVAIRPIHVIVQTIQGGLLSLC